MATIQGSIRGTDKIVNGSGTAVCRALLEWTKTDTATSVSMKCEVYIYCIRYGYQTSGTLSASLDATGKDGYSVSGGSCDLNSGGKKLLMAKTYSFSKTTSSQSKTISFSVTSNGSSIHGTSKGSLSVSIPALESYSVSYNGNGATSGSMSAQTKYYGKSLTLRSNAFSRTGYNFSKFNTNASGTGKNYSSGGTYTTNAKATLYAQWTPQTHTITYYGNGATGGSTYTQTKTYGQTTILYNNFTRTGYSITGWNTAADGSGTAYSTTQELSATFNSNLTLYAQWRLNYTKATISNLTIQRVENASSLDEYDQGTVLYVYFEYKTGSASGQWTENPLDELSCTITIDNNEVINNILSLNTTGDNIGGGFLRRWFSNGITGYDTEHSHTVIITLTSGGQSVSKTITISPSTFPIDLLVNNDEVYMGVMHPAQTGIPLITAPLKVDGDITTTGGITTTGNITVGNNKITLNGTNGNITTTGGITVNGNLTIGGSQTITIGNGTTISGTVNATGQYQRHGNTYIITDSIIITSSTSIPGTSSSSDSYKSITSTAANTRKDGYTLIGVTSYNIQNADSGGANSSHVMCYGCYIDTSANTVTIKVRNLASSAAVVKISARCLYRAN